LIAQEVLKIIPELVVEDEEGYLRIRFTELNIYILQAVKELYYRLVGIENQHSIQKNRLDKVEASKADKLAVDAKIMVLEYENAQLKSKLEIQAREIASIKDRIEKLEKILISK